MCLHRTVLSERTRRWEIAQRRYQSTCCSTWRCGTASHYITSLPHLKNGQNLKKFQKSQNSSGIADRASGSILEPPEGPKYDFWAQILEIVKIENLENFIEIFGGRFAVCFPYFSVTSLGASIILWTQWCSCRMHPATFCI